MEIKTYNKKEFLLPESVRSCAMVHAKIMQTGEYMFRVHDCNTGIRLRGNLNDPDEISEAIRKLQALAFCANQLADYIVENYTNLKDNNEINY